MQGYAAPLCTTKKFSVSYNENILKKESICHGGSNATNETIVRIFCYSNKKNLAYLSVCFENYEPAQIWVQNLDFCWKGKIVPHQKI